MTTEIAYPPFIESSENLAGMNNFMSLLNFWHISKINKEREYIKRHGLHPTLHNFIQKRYEGGGSFDINTFELQGSSDIQKMVYTVFRIYLEKKFPNYEVSKVRDMPVWVFTIDENEFGLENPIFLMVNSLRMLNRNNFSIFTLNNLETNARYRTNYDNKFSISYRNLQDKLLIPQLEKDLTEIEAVLASEVDGLITRSLGLLMGKDKFLIDLGIDPKAKAKPVRKKLDSSVEVEIEVAPTGRAMPRPAASNQDVQFLAELYRSLCRPMQGLPAADICNYLISYSRVANPERQPIQINGQLVTEFDTAIRNAA